MESYSRRWASGPTRKRSLQNVYHTCISTSKCLFECSSAIYPNWLCVHLLSNVVVYYLKILQWGYETAAMYKSMEHNMIRVLTYCYRNVKNLFMSVSITILLYVFFIFFVLKLMPESSSWLLAKYRVSHSDQTILTNPKCFFASLGYVWARSIACQLSELFDLLCFAF